MSQIGGRVYASSPVAGCLRLFHYAILCERKVDVLKSEKRVSELWRIKARIGLGGVKSPKRGASGSLIIERIERGFRKSIF